MPQSHQWSLGRIFLWVFVAALVFSHLATYFQNVVSGGDPIVHVETVQEWINKLDETAITYHSGENSFAGDEAKDLTIDCCFSTENASVDDVLSHMNDYFTAKAKEEGWSIAHSVEDDESLKYLLFRESTRLRVYCWVLSETKPTFVDAMTKQGKTAIHIRLIQFGY